MSGARHIPRVLTIAGSDSGGGAGIQADLKAFVACGVFGMTAITAITAQNTVGVRDVHHVPPETILAQVRAVAQDIGVDAVKIGMLGTLATIEAVALALSELAPNVPVVIDPVMVAESGAQLLDEGARGALARRLLPLAAVVTPNVPEARVLAATAGLEPAGGPPARGLAAPAGVEPAGGPEARGLHPEDLARAVHGLGPRYVVVTGGHRERAIDLFFDGVDVIEIPGPRHPDGASHGSGCTHSSVLAARLAWGDTPLQAARVAKELASRAVADGLGEIGAGAGPVDILGLRAGATGPTSGSAPPRSVPAGGPSARPRGGVAGGRLHGRDRPPLLT